MAKISIFGVLTNVQMLVHTWIKGRRVGEDTFGNVYYRGKPRRGTVRERRWVLYKDKTEASAVPAEWHGWLHHQTDVVPTSNENQKFRKEWQKPHQPNLTGSSEAYLPPGHPAKGGKRDATTGDYTPWQPPQ